jgi:xylulokinase
MASKQHYLIGVDIGTQGTKANLFDVNGKCLAGAFQKSRLHKPTPGVVEENPEFQISTVCSTIAECVKKSGIDKKSVAAIGIDGQMAGVIGIGKNGKHITPYDSWLDTRCAPQILEMKFAAEKEIIEKTGGPASFNHGPKILWWRKHHSAVYKKIFAFVQPGGYTAMRLCGMDGSHAFIDTTYLHFSGFADTQKKSWDKGLTDTFKIDPANLPRIVEPHAAVGTLSPEMAKRCGLVSGVPVVAGCGDTAASFLACGATRAGICVDVAGTASVFSATTNKFITDTRHKLLSCSHAATPGLFHAYAYINGQGMNLEWFRLQIAACGDKAKTLSFETLEKLANKISPAPDLPFFVPHLGGRVSPPEPNLRGSWAGLSWSHEIGHLYRSILEGGALEYALYKEVLSGFKTNISLSELRVTGGGEMSPLWNQIKADVLQLNVAGINRKEGAPLGAALLAGYGVGLIPDLDKKSQIIIHTQKNFKPQKQTAEYYHQRLERYRTLLDLLNRWSEL